MDSPRESGSVNVRNWRCTLITLLQFKGFKAKVQTLAPNDIPEIPELGCQGKQDFWCPREDSNLRTRFRKPMLYPLSYEGGTGV